MSPRDVISLICALPWGTIGSRVNTFVRDMPGADHKRVQGNSLYPQHGAAMTSMHKVYFCFSLSLLHEYYGPHYVFQIFKELQIFFSPEKFLFLCLYILRIWEENGIHRILQKIQFFLMPKILKCGKSVKTKQTPIKQNSQSCVFPENLDQSCLSCHAVTVYYCFVICFVHVTEFEA